jgi:cardiolipin synthase A/B
MTEPMIEADRNDPRRRWHWWWIALLAVGLLVAGAMLWARQSTFTPPPAATSVADVPQPGATPAPPVTGIFIQPGDGRAPLLDEIRAARQSIDLEVYLLSDETILQSLEEAQRRGVAVRVILEEHPFGGGGGQEEIFARLENAGIAVRWGNPVFRFSQMRLEAVEPGNRAVRLRSSVGCEPGLVSPIERRRGAALTGAQRRQIRN